MRYVRLKPKKSTARYPPSPKIPKATLMLPGSNSVLLLNSLPLLKRPAASVTAPTPSPMGLEKALDIPLIVAVT